MNVRPFPAAMHHLITLGRLALHEEGPDGPAVIENAKPLAVPAILAKLPGGEGYVPASTEGTP